MGGGSSQVRVNPSSRNFVHALRRLVSGAVSYEPGCDSSGYLPQLTPDLCRAPGGRGMLDMAVFPGKDWPSGEAMGSRPVESMAEDAMRPGLVLPRNPVQPGRKGSYSVRLAGVLTPPAAGVYEFGLACSGRARFRVGGQVIAELPRPGGAGGPRPQSVGDMCPRMDEVRVCARLAAGCGTELEVEWVPSLRPPVGAHLLLGCRPRAPRDDPSAALDGAAAAAAAADAAVVVVGHTSVDETEGRDSAGLAIEAPVLELIRRVAAANARTVLVLNSCVPRDVGPVLGAVPAVVVSWFGGQEAAAGLASALVEGGWGPCGRLPFTWPRALGDTPAAFPDGAEGPRYPGVFADAAQEQGRVFYEEGLLLGYRWYQHRAIPPLFAFGHGLGYSSIAYRALELSCGAELPAGRGVELRVTVANTGTRPTKEVVQAYVAATGGAPLAGVKQLRAFAKRALAPGEAATVTLQLEPSALPAPGFEVLVGPSSADTPLRRVVRVA
ncbi:unnamed protein product [Prorocentrum cordatum]|uniref:beta-glucosidase n=1 Tax=Prorocentrum cordatum TaxID=2364126 RepID=A0ABN9XBL0_9DINO|nr:unnamed protein product [Polarella glacialis]